MKSKTRVLTTLLALVFVALPLALPVLFVSAQTGNNPVNIQVLDSVGGTTDPAPGSYSYDQGTTYSFTAVADPGFVFDHWVVTGDVPGGSTDQMITVSDNPLAGDCGYGYTYQFQAVFTPESAAAAKPVTIPVIYFVAVVAALIAVAAAVSAIAFKAGKKRAS
jgi:hypothetical protein